MRYVVGEQSRSEAPRQGQAVLVDSQVLTRLVISITCRGLWHRFMWLGIIKLVGFRVDEQAGVHFDIRKPIS